MQTGLPNVQMGPIFFLILNLLAVGFALLALRVQARYIDSASEQFKRLTDVEWEYSSRDISTIEALSFGIILVVILAIYPFLHSFIPFQQPYLISEFNQYGTELQLIVGFTLWAPTIAITAKGLVEALHFSHQLRWKLQSVEPAVDPEESLEAVRGLLGYAPTWFFRMLQILLLMWGLVGGITIGITFFVGRKLLVLIGVTIAVMLILAYIFVVPIISLARWITARSNAIQSTLRTQLVETQLQAVASGFETGNGVQFKNTRKDTTSVELQNVIESLPPTHPLELLWEQSLQTLAGLLGPTATLVVKMMTG